MLHVRGVGFRALAAGTGTGSSGQRRLSVGFGPSSVDVGGVLQDSWRIAVRGVEGRGREERNNEYIKVARRGDKCSKIARK